MLAGRFGSSLKHLEDVLALYDPISHSSLLHLAGEAPDINSHAALGIVLSCLGYPNQAVARTRAAIAEARRLAHPPSLASSLSNGAVVLWLVGNSAVLEEWVDQLLAIAAEQGFPYWRAHADIYRGWVKVKNGNVAEGLSLLRSGSAAYDATGAEPGMDNVALLAQGCEIAGQIEEAVSLLDDALHVAETSGERWFAAELNRRKGALLLQLGHTQTAEELYCKALSIAREQEAKLWELRAAVSLARLWVGQGKHADARDLLAPVYGWFTEGFGTPDLKKAKALLDELEGG
jgi:predicted ATPase